MRQGSAGSQHRLQPLLVRRYNKNSEPLPTETGTMHILRPGGGISQKFSIDAASLQSFSFHRHGATVRLHTKPDCSARNLYSKDTIGNQTAFQTFADVNRPLFLSGRKQANVGSLSTRQLDRNHHVGNHEGVFEEQPANLILPTPINTT